MNDDTIVDVRDWGALKASNINAALAVMDAGRTLEVPDRIIDCDEPIRIERDDVRLNLNGATLLKKFTGAPLVSLRSPYGAANKQKTGLGLMGGILDGQEVNDGLPVLELDSVSQITVDTTVTGQAGAGNSAVIAKCGVGGTDLAGSCSIQDSSITLRINQHQTTNQRLAHCFRAIGSVNSNLSCNKGKSGLHITAHHHTGRAAWIESMDRTAVTVRSWKHGGAGAAIWAGGPKAGLPVGCEGNVFDASCDGAIYAEGTNDGASAGVTNVITPNYLNGTPTPVAGYGSRWIEIGEFGDLVGAALVKSVMADSRWAALMARAGMGAETVVIHNGSQAHVKITDGVNAWMLRINGAGDLDLARLAGTGRFNLPYETNFAGHVVYWDANNNLKIA